MIAPVPASRSAPRYWATVAGVSVVAAVAVALIHGSHAPAGVFGRILASSLVYAATIGGLGGLIVPRVVRSVTPERSARRWALRVALLLAVAVAGTLVAGALVTLLGLAPRGPFLMRFREDLQVAALLVVALGIGISLFEALRRDLEAATAALHARAIEEERTRKLAAEARLASLEARLHPHFLFNALNAISALIQEDPARAERMVERLAALLRVALDAGRRGTTPLAEELRLVGDYLEIEKARLGDRLDYAIEGGGDIAGCAVLPLSVQTLAENSIKHAIAPRPAGGRLRVDARVTGDDFAVRVWDDGAGFQLDAGGPGHGLDTLQARLAERFAGEATLTVERRDGGTLVTMTLPRDAALAR